MITKRALSDAAPSSIASSVSDAAAKAGSDLIKSWAICKRGWGQIAAARSAAENAASEVAKNVKEGAASSERVQSVKGKAQSAASGVLRSASAAAGIAAEEAVKGANAATAAARTAAEAAKAAVKAAKEAADKHKPASKSDPHLRSEPEVAHSTFNFEGTERLFKTLTESIVTDEVIERINKMIKNYNQYDREFFTDQKELFDTYNLLDRVTETVLVELSPQK